MTNRKVNIAVIDDISIIDSRLKEYFETFIDPNMIIVEDFVETLETIRFANKKLDLIVVEPLFSMMDEDGYQFSRVDVLVMLMIALADSENNQDTPVIVLTHVADPELEAMAMAEFGVKDYLVKLDTGPIELQEATYKAWGME